MDRMRKAMSGALLLVWLLAAGAIAAPALEDDDALKAKALELNALTGKEAMTAKLRELVKDEANTKKLLTFAAKLAKEKDQPFNYNAAFVLARTAHALKDYASGEVFYRVAAAKATALLSTEKLVEVYDGLIDLHFDNNKLDEAVKAAQEFLEIEGGERLERIKPFVLERLIQAKAKQGKIDEALMMAQKYIDLDEDQWFFVNVKAGVLREGGRYEEAEKAYLDVLKRLRRADLEDEPRERLTERTRYILSGVYVDLKQIDKGAEQLQMLLKKNPENATYNNDLGYIWSDNDVNLDESEKLIRKALEIDRAERAKLKEKLPDLKELDKDNSAYLDSLGWVLFKKKQYPEAKKYLAQAVEEKEGQHIEIMDHLADVLVALGEKKEAIAIWEKALKLDNSAKREQKRKKVVEEKLAKLKAETK